MVVPGVVEVLPADPDLLAGAHSDGQGRTERRAVGAGVAVEGTGSGGKDRAREVEARKPVQPVVGVLAPVMTPAFATWYWNAVVCATGCVAPIPPLLADVGDIQRGDRHARVVHVSRGPVESAGAARADAAQRPIRHRVRARDAEAVLGSRRAGSRARVVGRPRGVPARDRDVVRPGDVRARIREAIEALGHGRAQRAEADLGLRGRRHEPPEHGQGRQESQ